MKPFLTAVPIALATLTIVGQDVAGDQARAPAVDSLASRMTGTWKLNRELSPDLNNPRRGREGRGAGLLFVATSVAAQRSGRGGGGGGGEPGGGDPPPVPTEIAAQAALTQLQQIPLELTIAATEAEVRFTEPRGQLICRIDRKSASMDVPGGSIKIKSKWERANLRQEFSSAQRTLIRSWSVGSDDRLVLTQRMQSATFRSKDTQAVFDKQSSK